MLSKYENIRFGEFWGQEVKGGEEKKSLKFKSLRTINSEGDKKEELWKENSKMLVAQEIEMKVS